MSPVLGHSHALSGAVAGLAVGSLVLHEAAAPLALLAGLTTAAGFASASDALRIGGHFGNLVALGGAAAMCWTGYGLALVPLAAALGTGTHVVGDMATLTGCPLLWPATMREFHIMPRPLRFTTGKTAEHWVITPLLLAALAFLVWHAGMPVLTARTAIGAP